MPLTPAKAGVRAVIALLAMVAALPATAAAQLPNPLFTWSGSADPGVTIFGDRFYAAATGDDAGGAGRIRSSADLRTWSNSGYIFPRGTEPSWIAADRGGGRGIGGPQIYLLPSGKYVAYFSARADEPDIRRQERRCIGRAESFNPYDFTNAGLGPTPAISPLECRDDKAYSLIDPSLFYDPRGRQLYLLYKRDYDDGGPTPDDIVIRPVGPDGRSNLGPPTQLVEAERKPPKGEPWEGFSVEAPTMIYRQRTNRYYLFYSGANYAKESYAVGVAASSRGANRPDSKFVKFPGNPILRGEGNDRFCGVGHQDVTNVGGGDSWQLFYHAYLGGVERDRNCVGSIRYLMMDPLRWDQAGGSPRVNHFWPSVSNRTPSGAGENKTPPGPLFKVPPVSGSMPGPAQSPKSTPRLRVGAVRLAGRALSFNVRNSTVAGTASVRVLRGPQVVARSSRTVPLGETQKSLNVPLNRSLERGVYTTLLAVRNKGRLVGLESAKLRVG